jgi:hypothetical protein
LFSEHISYDLPSSSYRPNVGGDSPYHTPKNVSGTAVSMRSNEPSPLPRRVASPPLYMDSPSGQDHSFRRRTPSPSYTIRNPPQPPLQNFVESTSLPTSTSITMPSPESVVLPGRPPSMRAGTPTSVYSSYSYYELESPSQSQPSSRSTSRSPSAHSESNHSQPQYGHTSSRRSPSPSLNPIWRTDPQSQTPQDYLQLGIQHHEANRLQDSAVCFELSAKEQGGCGVGMLMWGLTLRHGWGCEKNEKSGFNWLRKAAEISVADLESTRGGMEASAVQVRRELQSRKICQLMVCCPLG